MKEMHARAARIIPGVFGANAGAIFDAENHIDIALYDASLK